MERKFILSRERRKKKCIPREQGVRHRSLLQATLAGRKGELLLPLRESLWKGRAPFLKERVWKSIHFYFGGLRLGLPSSLYLREKKGGKASAGERGGSSINLGGGRENGSKSKRIIFQLQAQEGFFWNHVKLCNLQGEK